MAGTPVDIVRRVLSDLTDPAVVSELVAEDSVRMSLNYEDDDVKKIMPWAGPGRGRQALLKTFTDVARYWQVEKLHLGDVFGEGERVAVFGFDDLPVHGLGTTVRSLFAVFARVRDGQIAYTQFMGDTFVTARSFRSGGTWTISSDPGGGAVEV